MNNGHEKLIAKIQHFYDLLLKKAEQYGMEAIDMHEEHVRKACAIRVDEYNEMACAYNDVFKEFLYNGENDAT